MENISCDLCGPCDLVLIISIKNHDTIIFTINLVLDAGFVFLKLVWIKQISGLLFLTHDFLMSLYFRNTILQYIFIIWVEVKLYFALLLSLKRKFLSSLIQLSESYEWRRHSISVQTIWSTLAWIILKVSIAVNLIVHFFQVVIRHVINFIINLNSFASLLLVPVSKKVGWCSDQSYSCWDNKYQRQCLFGWNNASKHLGKPA